MGKKKDKKNKKGKGAEKTAMKTEKRADKKTKKMLSEKGEVCIQTRSLYLPIDPMTLPLPKMDIQKDKGLGLIKTKNDLKLPGQRERNFGSNSNEA